MPAKPPGEAGEEDEDDAEDEEEGEGEPLLEAVAEAALAAAWAVLRRGKEGVVRSSTFYDTSARTIASHKDLTWDDSPSSSSSCSARH